MVCQAMLRLCLVAESHSCGPIRSGKLCFGRLRYCRPCLCLVVNDQTMARLVAVRLALSRLGSPRHGDQMVIYLGTVWQASVEFGIVRYGDHTVMG